MSLTQLLSDYGYAAVFVGSLLEGETILLLAGFAAHQGYLSLPLTVGIAFVGGTLGDQIFYWLGRVAGQPLLDRLPNATARVGRVNALLTRFDAPLIVGIRFMYGLRILGPIVIGTSSVPPWRFAIFNIIGAAMWAPLVAGVGFGFGQTLERLEPDFNKVEAAAWLGLLCVAIAVGFGHRWWRRSRH